MVVMVVSMVGTVVVMVVGSIVEDVIAEPVERKVERVVETADHERAFYSACPTVETHDMNLKPIGLCLYGFDGYILCLLANHIAHESDCCCCSPQVYP